MQTEGRAGRIRDALVLRLGPALHNFQTSLLVRQLQSSGPADQCAMQREGRAGSIRDGLVLRLGPALHNLHTSLLVQQLQSSGLADPEPVVAIELPKAGVSDAMEHLQLLEAMARSIDPDDTSWDQVASSGCSESAWSFCNTLGSRC